MAKLKIYEYPDPVLKQKAAPVEKVDDVTGIIPLSGRFFSVFFYGAPDG